MKPSEHFDYVIIGGGSAGCVLANRLSQDLRTSVCLVEAGPADRSPLIHIPAALFTLMRHRTLNWRFETAPQERMNGAAVYVPRGRALGGSSAINGMVYIRGHRDDYDEWEAAGLPGWGWEDVLPYFLKSEHNEIHVSDRLHGQGGPLNVTCLERPNPLDETLVEAAESLQYNRNEDFNGAVQDGFGVFQVTQRDGRRCSAAAAFLNPARGRPNLDVRTGRQVARIVLEGRRAVGVALAGDARDHAIGARREVILSSGAIASPQLMMLSGIGDARALGALGIPLCHALPAVGKNLQDHISARVEFDSPSLVPYGLSPRTMPLMAWSVLRYALSRRGFWTSNLIEAGGFLRTDPAASRPDIQIGFVPGQRGRNGRLFGWGHGFSATATLLRPRSRGEVTLNSATPSDRPRIDPCFFAEPEDLDTLVRGFEVARRLLYAPAFDPYRGAERMPGPEIDGRAALSDWVRTNAHTIFHPVGTCRMGADADSVVDPQLRVRGIERLRVVDASVMPRITGGNTNAPTIMIAEKAADMIKAA